MGKLTKKLVRDRLGLAYDKKIQAKHMQMMSEQVKAEKILQIAAPKMRDELKKDIAAFMLAEVFMTLRSMDDPYGAKRLEQFYRKWLILDGEVQKHPEEFTMKSFVDCLNSELHTDINAMMERVAKEITA